MSKSPLQRNNTQNTLNRAQNGSKARLNMQRHPSQKNTLKRTLYSHLLVK